MRKITWSENKTTKIGEIIHVQFLHMWSPGPVAWSKILFLCCFQVLPVEKNIFLAIFNWLFLA